MTISTKYLLLINLLLQDFSGAQCLKHSFLGIVHFLFSPYLAPNAIKMYYLCTQNKI